jgi:hypothetical protein
VKVTFLGLLSLLFIALKIMAIITWSWWVILLPIYAPIVVALVMIFLGLGFAVALAKAAS